MTTRQMMIMMLRRRRNIMMITVLMTMIRNSTMGCLDEYYDRKMQDGFNDSGKNI